MSRRAPRVCMAAAVLLVAMSVASPAVAGPPMLCHPFDIGDARSLPWDGSRSWFHVRADYPIANVVRDTEALLTPSTPVIVRMETIRRAALYATLDREVAATLFARISARAQDPKAGALALLDATLLTETYRQLAKLDPFSDHRPRARIARAVVGSADSRALLARTLAASPDDAAVQFAAALIVADKDRKQYEQHVLKARAGAGSDALLARNLNHVS